MSFRKFLSVSTALILAFMLFTGSALAASTWESFGAGDSCTSPASIDGDLIAYVDEWEDAGQLYIYDLARDRLSATDVEDAERASIKGDIVAYFNQSHGLSFYNLKGKKITETEVVAMIPRYWHPARFFNGEYVAYFDPIDFHLKLYRFSDGQVTDTGAVKARYYNQVGYPQIDGNIVTFGRDLDPNGAHDNVVSFYNIQTGQITNLEEGRNPVVSGNIIAYISPDYPRNLKYYDISTGETVDLGFAPGPFSLDGNKVVYTVRDNGPVYGHDVYVYDISTGQHQLVVADYNSCACWIDIQGNIIVYERYEGDTNEDFNGDGDIDDCVAGYADLSL